MTCINAKATPINSNDYSCHIAYSGKFSRTINCAVLVDFTSTTKIIFLNSFPEQADCLCDQIDCFTCDISLYNYFAVKYKLQRPTGPLSLSLSLSLSAIVAANGEITKVVDSEKEETMKNCSLAWPDHSSCRVLSLSVYTESDNALCGREVWLVSHNQPFFLWTACPRCTKSAQYAGKRVGYARLRSGHTRPTCN